MISKVLQRFSLQSLTCYRRNFCQLALRNHSGRLEESTLISRILIYFDPTLTERAKNCRGKEVGVVQRMKRDVDCNLHDRSLEEIKSLFLLSNNSQCVESKHDFLKVFSKLDTECYFRLNELKNKDILDILRMYVQITPERVVQFKFYEAAINKLSENIEALTESELLQYVFFVGLRKKDKQAQNILRRCLRIMNEDFIKKLGAEELCIVCNATFKTSTKINNQAFLERVKDFINDNLYVLKDPAVFITLIKTVRHNECQDDNLLSTISCAVFFNRTLQYYGFMTVCHLLALYADYMYYDENILKHFSIRCIEQLKKTEPADITDEIRDKDLKRLLWCLSRLGYNLDADLIRNDVIPIVIERMRKGDLRKDPHTMVDIVLYLWMMNYQAVELLPFALSEGNVRFIYESNLSKRLSLLLTAIYFENRPVFRELDVKIRGSPSINKEQQIRTRPTLKRVMDNLKVILPKTELNKFEFVSQIPYFDIVGITGFKKNIYKAVHVEVLDEATSLKNTHSKPSGIMQMKLRILDGFEEGLVVVSVLPFFF